VVTTGRFGFFGGAAAVEVSAPDFLCSTAAAVVDFLPSPPLSVAFGSSLPAVLSSPGSEDWDGSDEAGGEDDSAPEGVESFGESFGDDEESEDAESDEDEPVDPVSDGPAHATPGVVATATPTPKATAKPPTRPMYLE
jgi:hypothetical protein